MRFYFVVACALLASVASGQQQVAYLQGALLPAEPGRCTNNTTPHALMNASLNLYPANDPRNHESTKNHLGAEDSAQDALCAEYLVATDRVIYRIRPKVADQMPDWQPGKRVFFRLQNDGLLLWQESTNQELVFTIISLMPRAESAADARRLRLNHLQ